MTTSQDLLCKRMLVTLCAPWQSWACPPLPNYPSFNLGLLPITQIGNKGTGQGVASGRASFKLCFLDVTVLGVIWRFFEIEDEGDLLPVLGPSKATRVSCWLRKL